MMEKYLNKVICADCLDILKELPDKSVDLVVTSPPYNMGGRSLGNTPNSTVGTKHYDKFNDDMSDNDYVHWTISVLKECLRVSRYVAWNVQWVPGTRNMISAIHKDFGKNLKDIFIWNKHAVSVINGKRGAMAKGWEYVFILGEDSTSNFRYNSFPENGYVPNRQTWYKKESFKEHHATFPEELPTYFIEYLTKKNDLVFDPFLGSGTTCVAAKKLGRNFLGTDVSNNYCKLATERLNGASSPLF